MGKIRTKLIGLEEVEKKQKEEAKIRREEKKKREGKIRPIGGKGGERMKQVEVSEEELKKMEKAKEILEKKEEVTEEKKLRKIGKKIRGKNYQQARLKIDKNKKHLPKEAVALLKKIKFGKFDETVELHLNVLEKGLKGEATFPHGAGKERRVTIVDEKVLEKLEKGKIDFDVLITHPQYMPKLVKYAKILGPRGLMPNPKTGTISEKPEEVAKKFQSGLLQFKTEPKFPIIHQAIGKISFSDKALIENLTAFIKAVGVSKIKSAFLKSTMSPSIRLNIEEIK